MGAGNDYAKAYSGRDLINLGEGNNTALGMDGVDPERQAGVIRVLEHVWFSSLLGWVNGWTNVRDVPDEIEHAVHLLLNHV